MHPIESQKAKTLAEAVLQVVRRDILEGRHRPGSKLPFQELHTTYSVSFSTLREVLSYLVQEGLVTAEGQRGFRVAPALRSEFYDLCDSRVVIERAAIARALPRGDGAWEASLRRLLEQLQQAGLAVDAQPAPSTIHDLIVAPCGSPTLLDLRRRLAAQALRYEHLAGLAPGGDTGARGQDIALLDAALHRNVSTTADLREAQLRADAAAINAQAANLWQDN